MGREHGERTWEREHRRDNMSEREHGRESVGK